MQGMPASSQDQSVFGHQGHKLSVAVSTSLSHKSMEAFHGGSATNQAHPLPLQSNPDIPPRIWHR